ncbi:phosphomethylpyrimidine synthase ThiC [bacterium]|nr:phosphomethylpyrimidine synthase ThiC [bacterium]MBU4561754.1 phosphomethylpyrimidine synthase ThiC [bacterium]MCG2676605.1 phosphomethylpyrimidine synthase ThiC [bacterium]
MTQLTEARKGRITKEMRYVARQEGLKPEVIRRRIAKGEIVIPANTGRKRIKWCGIGKGLRVKVNANIGTSPQKVNTKNELAKLKAAQEAGADTVMDLSIGGDLKKIRRRIISETNLPLGTVPIYQVIINTVKKKKFIAKMTKGDILGVIEEQARDGVDFMTLHAGVTQRTLEILKKKKRMTGIVSRGGAFLAEWMIFNERENPLYEEYDEVLEIAKKYDVTLSLGDGLRPGSLADASDEAQIEELVTLGKLAKRARRAGVQVMIEGPGHMPLDQIEANVELEKRLCQGAPYYVLGPLTTDVASGYDHIAGAIGGALAAWKGADFLCYVTPAEHLRLPTARDVWEGVIVTRIAAHSADIAKGIKRARNWDDEMSRARGDLRWRKMINLALDTKKAKRYHPSLKEDTCTMCGEYCAIKRVKEYFR